MPKVYIYENGSCRGDVFTNRNSVDKDELITLLKGAIDLDLASDEFDDYVEDYCDSETNYSLSKAIVGLMTGGDFCLGDKDEERRKAYNSILNDEPIFLEFEESNVAYASSPKAALLTYVLNGEEDDLCVVFNGEIRIIDDNW